MNRTLAPAQPDWRHDMIARSIEGLLWDIGQAILALDWLAKECPELATECRARAETMRREYAAVEALQRATVKQPA